MHDIVKLAIESGLKFPPRQKSVVVVDPTFGVFVSVERSKALLSWPKNIHGCIGYWDPHHNLLDNQTIIQKIKEVSYSATWDDPRRNYFLESIYVDLRAKFKVYVMLYPVQMIDSNGLIGSEPFNNIEYGLIVEQKDTTLKATYLPGVFPTESWSIIKQQLIQKAGVKLNNLIFYAYKTTEYSASIVDYLIEPIVDFINSRYVNFVPHTINGSIILTDKTDAVRNLATINTILQLEKYGYHLNSTVLVAIDNNLAYYKEKNITNQALAFLLQDLYLINKYDVNIDVIKRKLYRRLEATDVEPNFELGEILSALLIVDPNDRRLSKYLTKISQQIDTNQNEIDIFKYNWYSKLLKGITDKNYPYYLVKKTLAYLETFKQTETNYYAVEFELLTTLYAAVNSATKKLIEPYIEHIMIRLQEVRNDNGLYQFISGISRMDITCHVLEGLYVFL